MTRTTWAAAACLAAATACDAETSRFDGQDDPSVVDGTDAVGTPPAGDDDDDGSTSPDDGWPAPWAALEDEVLVLVNQLRARGTRCGGDPMAPVPPLASQPQLREAARLHSADMGERGYFSHTGPTSGSFVDRIEAAGYTGPQPWGENIAAGTSSAQAVVDMWEDSEGHCQNMMHRDYATIGIGYAAAPDDPTGLVDYWTQDFGGG